MDEVNIEQVDDGTRITMVKCMLSPVPCPNCPTHPAVPSVPLSQLSQRFFLNSQKS